MKVYKLRYKGDGEFAKKLNSYGGKTKVDRLYSEKRHAASAATSFMETVWNQEHMTKDAHGRNHITKSWWSVSDDERREFREKHIEIVEYDCIEVDKEGAT